MLYRIIVSRADGDAYAEKIRSAVPAVFPDHSLFSGRPSMLIEDMQGRRRHEFPEEITQDPKILYRCTSSLFHVQLSPEVVSKLPHVVPIRD